MQSNKLMSRFTAGVLLASALISPALAVSGTVNTEGSNLRIRAQASTQSAILGKLAHGTMVEVMDTAANGGWYQIAYNGIQGFVSADYLTVQEESKPAENAAQVETPAQPEAPAETETPAQPQVPADQAEADEAAPLYVKITASALNVRSGPGTDYDKVGRLGCGRVVEVLETSGDWYRIEQGYISAEYTEISDRTPAEANSLAQEIVDYALGFVGYPYVYGGMSPRGFDCSGFTSYVYKQFGYSLNRSAASQLDNGTPVSMSELQPGDLVLFRKGNSAKRATHVGLYIGDNQFVHASTAKVGVIVSSLDQAYYTPGFVGGRRII